MNRDKATQLVTRLEANLMQSRLCLYCGNRYQRKGRRIYCSPPCRITYLNRLNALRIAPPYYRH